MLVSSSNKLSCATSLLLVTIVTIQLSSSHAFCVVPSNGSAGSLVHRLSKTQLCMGQMNKRNKQADLMKKMQLAKQQAQTDDPSTASSAATANDNNKGLTGTSAALTEEEIKKSNDMKRFEDLLNREGATTRMSDDSYRTEEEELNEATASWKGKGGDRIFEGDPAPAEPFEELVSIGSENALGKAGAERLVPWLHKNVNRHNDYLVIVTDPRSKSTDLRQTMKYLKGQLTPNILAPLDNVHVYRSEWSGGTISSRAGYGPGSPNGDKSGNIAL
eukprot:scaffold1101_cov52-Attheya_sp.AAC.4